MRTMGRILGPAVCASLILAVAAPVRGAGLDDLLKLCPSVKLYQPQKDDQGKPDPNFYTVYCDDAHKKSLEVHVDKSGIDPNVRYLWVSGMVKKFDKQPSADTLAAIGRLNEDSNTRPGSLSMYKGSSKDGKELYMIFVNFYLPFDTDAKNLNAFVDLTAKVREALAMQFTFAQ